LGQFDRAVTADPTLWKLVRNDRKTAHATTVARLTLAVMAGLPDPGTDRAVFFKIVLSDMRLPYESEEASLVTNIRNDDQHLVESHFLDTASQPPVILFKYYRIMHTFGRYYPLFFCHFFQAMHSQGLVLNYWDKTLSHLMKQMQ